MAGNLTPREMLTHVLSAHLEARSEVGPSNIAAVSRTCCVSELKAQEAEEGVLPRRCT